MTVLKSLPFVLSAIIIVILAGGTIAENISKEFVAADMFRSAWFVAMWALMAVSAIVWIAKRRLHKRLTALMIHAALAVILIGALTSWLTSESGRLTLHKGATAEAFTLDDGSQSTLPFSVTLKDFNITYYTGTDAPMDFISTLTIARDSKVTEGTVSMNNVPSVNGYRFYQSGYGADGEESVFTIAHDVWGIGITYAGYALLLISMIAFLLDNRTRFRMLVKKMSGKTTLLLVALLLTSTNIGAAERELKTIPEDAAKDWGEMYVLYGDRICPLQTMAREFTAKICGKTTYEGLSAEQVMAGWLYYPTEWSREPMIKIKSAEVRRLLGIKGKYASVRDFFSDTDGYKLEAPLKEIDKFADPRGLREAAEKFNLVNNLVSGKTMKIFPLNDEHGRLTWYAQADNVPLDTDDSEYMFIKMSMSYSNELVQAHRWDELRAFYQKVKKYQQKKSGDTLPSEARFNAELAYNRIAGATPLAILLVLAGIVAFFHQCLADAKRRAVKRWIPMALKVLLAVSGVYLTSVMALLWYVGGHVPMSNGYETMLFMSWCTVPITLLVCRHLTKVLPMGTLLCGLTMTVAMMSVSNPRVSQLMPVLQSPLLSIHVAVIMVAYALLSFMAFNGLAAIVIHIAGKGGNTKEIVRLKEQSELLLYPATFLLACGIFIGAVWANVSWGRYWGWDPKEVWALITMLIYAFAFHSESWKRMREPMTFHVYMTLAFFSVLFTYFGVNFFLAGMHSYA